MILKNQTETTRHVLITGGGGYIGAALTGYFLERGWAVRVMEVSVDRAAQIRKIFRRANYSPPLSVMVGNVHDLRSVTRACKGITHLIHLAGVANVNDCRRDPQKAIALNGYSTRILLEEVRKKPGFQKFIFPSSIAGMYTLPRKGRIQETASVFPVDDYGISKYLGEQFCRAYARLFGTPTVIFRQSNVYGPSPAMKYDNVIHVFVKNAIAEKQLVIHGNGNQARDFLYLDDLLRAYENALLIDFPPGREFNICSGENVSIRELAKLVLRATECLSQEKKRKIAFRKMKGQEIEIRKFLISNHRARKELKFNARISLEEGLLRLVQFLLKSKDAKEW